MEYGYPSVASCGAFGKIFAGKKTVEKPPAEILPEKKTVEKPSAEIMPEGKQLKNLRQKLCRRENS
jgi:hypothetical protein